ncbi:MAG: FkbM family methyltransferase [Chloroflexota bacterium]
MYFSLLSGNSNKVFIIEPDTESVDTWQRMIEQLKLDQVTVCPIAVWSCAKALKLYINDAHPASNFTGGTKDHYTEGQLAEYRTVELPADSLDNILHERDIHKADIVSITTNGAEREILNGMSQLIKRGLPHICLAVTGEGYIDMMKEYGYELLAHDERGFTFSQIS